DLMSVSSYDALKVSSVDLNNTVLSLNIGTINGGEQYTILSVAGTSGGVSNTFTGLAEGATITVGGQAFTISYVGGDGNDVVLTAQSSNVSIVSGYPAMNANPNNDPQYSYINSANATAQHSMVESVVYSFSAPILLTHADFSITN